MDLNKNFSLVLSGGSALGLAHIGVIKYLEENNIKPKEFIGTSMGALVAALYAKGLSYNEIISILKTVNFLTLFEPNLFKKGSLVKVDKIQKLLTGIFSNIKLSNLKTNLKIIATNAQTGEMKVFDKTSDVSIVDALCASVSIPAIFEPYKIKNDYYWDGFLSSNLPFECANYSVLAVDVYNDKIIQKNHLSRVKSSIEKSFAIMIVNQTKSKLQTDVTIINLDVSEFETYQFKKWDKIVEKGYNEFKKKLKDI